jgi:hypothetical protein
MSTALNLERADLLQVEPISCRGTLKLLPLGKKNKVRSFKLKYEMMKFIENSITAKITHW